MTPVLALVLASLMMTLAGVALTQAAYNLWRFRRPQPHRKPVPATYIGTAGIIASKSALIIIELITILYLAIGWTPVDGLLAVGIHAPTTMNKYLLLFGGQIQLIMATVSICYLNHSVKCCHFPRHGEGAEMRKPDEQADGTDGTDTPTGSC